MKKYFNYRKTLLGLAFCFTAAATAQIPVWHPDNGDGTFTNPLLWGDWPDPDLIRVGNDFYMVSTSMHYVPGCPILHSKDLINWDMAGYAIERYDEDPRYDLKGGNLYLNGSWAASIRHHNGKFYVAFCTPYGWGREKGNFSMCIADRPEGPWERVIFPEYMYDPGLLFDDDGKNLRRARTRHALHYGTQRRCPLRQVGSTENMERRIQKRTRTGRRIRHGRVACLQNQRKILHHLPCGWI